MFFILFNDVDEFLQELRHILPGGTTVRATYVIDKPRGDSSPYGELSVMASAVVAGGLLLLRVYCGEVWPEDGDSVSPKAEAVMNALQAGAKERGFDVRPGLVVLDAEDEALLRRYTVFSRRQT